MTRRQKILAGVTAATIGLTALGASAFADGRGHSQGLRGGHGGGHGGMQMLQMFDTDNNGALNQTEVDAGIAAQIVEADANNDAAISLEEFGTIWETMTEQARVRAFQRLDPNGDASVTAEELDERFGDIVAQMDRNGDGELSRDDRGRGGEGRRGGRRGGGDRSETAPAQPQ